MKKTLKIFSLSRLLLFAIICLVGSTTMSGQFNILVGYNTGFGNFNTNNQLLSSYTVDNGEVIAPFGNMSFMHGIQLGLRYRVKNIGLEFGWQNLGRDRNALSFNPNSDSFTDRQYNYSLSSLSLGVDNHIGAFGIGAAVQSTKLSIKRDINGNELSLISQSENSYRIHLIWVLQQSRQVALTLKPYIQLPLGNYDLSNLAVDLSVPGQDFSESLTVFGLSVVFYNGKQY